MKGPDLINSKLPDELIVEVFHRLDGKYNCDSFALVCRRWCGIDRACRRTLMVGAAGPADEHVRRVCERFEGLCNLTIDERRPVVPVEGPPISVSRRSKRKRQAKPKVEGKDLGQVCLSDAGLGFLAAGCKGLLKLSLIWCPSVTSLGLTTIADHCRFLKSLDLRGSCVGDNGLIAVGHNCKHFEDLNILFCGALSDKGLVGFAQSCASSLKLLSIAACICITDVSLQAVATHCSNLETLFLDSEKITNEGVISVAQGCRSLKALKLQCMHVTDEALLAVGSFCSSLELLALCNFPKFTDSSLAAIGNGCKKLKDLSLYDCYFLNDKSLEIAVSGCTKLTYFEINGCQNVGVSGIEHVGRSCPGLLELSLLYCPSIGNSALFEIGRGCSLLQSLQLVDCSRIDDIGICFISKGCRGLKKLDIRRCHQIGDAGVLSVAKNCKLLTDLSLRFCNRVGDEALVAIAQGCSLQYLNVSGCCLITNVGLMEVARCCPNLVSLDISMLQSIEDMTLAELGHGCPLLKEIIMSHCQRTTDAGLHHLVNGCTRLETCLMIYCPLITDVGVASVVSSCPNMKKLLVEKSKVSQRTSRRASTIMAYIRIEY